MSGRPFSLNDIPPVQIKIRRDQFKKIKGIVDTNAKFPSVALGLVRDYIKNSSARDTVAAVNYGNEPLDTPDPEYIVVHSKNSGSENTEDLGTTYYFKLKPDPRIEKPTL